MSSHREMLAWAAGFFEGEGCVGRVTGTEASIVLTIVNADLERLRLFAEITNGGRIRKRNLESPLSRKPLFTWQAYGENAIRIFRDLEPWLGERRRARFAELHADRVAHVAKVTAPRVCPSCRETFAPRWSSGAARQRFCSTRCYERARPSRGSGRGVARGERIGISKLSETDVRIIRRRRAQGETCVGLAAEFGVSSATVSAIVLRRTWKHVRGQDVQALLDDHVSVA